MSYFDVDREPFNGRPLTVPADSKVRRVRRGKHGTGCGVEAGCVCGYAEYVNDHDGSDAGW